MTELTDRIDASLREITEPLMQQLRDLNENIALREEELTELRAGRTRLVSIARQIDPALVPKKEQPKAAPTVSAETIQAVYDWIKENVNGDEFYASGLNRDPNFDVTSQSQVAKSLTVLHEQGRIRLVRQGSGGSKHYKLVSA